MSGPYTQTEGFQGSVGFDTANPVTRGFEVDSIDLGLSQEIIDTTGLRGTRERFSNRTRPGKQSFAGPAKLQPSAEDLQFFLPQILGGAFSDGTSTVTDTLPDMYVTVDKVAKVCTYGNVYVNKGTFTAAEGVEMSLELDLVGMSETVTNGGTFPSVTYNDTPPFMFYEAELTMLGTSRLIKSFTLTVDNMLEILYQNSITPTSIIPKDRHISFQCDVPWIDDNVDLYDQDPDGAAATLVLTFGSKVLTFDFGSLQVPTKNLTLPGRQALYLPIDAVVRGVISTDITPSLSASLSLG
jgi:hypothetical protein